MRSGTDGRPTLPTVLAVAGLALGALASCAEAGGAPPEPLRIAVTIAPLTSIVANVAGPDAEIVGLVPEGVDAHRFEPTGSLDAPLEAAEVVFANGLGLDASTIEAAEATVADDVEVVALGDTVREEDASLFERSFPDEADDPNPHLYLAPMLAKRYAEEIRDVLVEVHPDGRDIYQSNYEQYAGRLDDLDEALRAATETIAPDDRQLLTYHDAYPYLAAEHGWTEVGAVQPPTLEEATATEVAAAVEAISESDVPAIFGSVEFPSAAVDRIAEEADVPHAGDLRDEDLPGAPGDPGHSYLGMLQGDLLTIVEALGGDPAALRTADITDVVEDRASYPQAP